MFPSSIEFPSTHWSFVADVRDANFELRRELINTFLTQYMEPLRAHIARQFPKIKHVDREDLLQDFIASRILQKSILDRALRKRGRLRSLLRVSFNNFIKNWLSKHQADPLSKANVISYNELSNRSEDDPAFSFDLAWARFVLTEAVSRLRVECDTNGRQLMWDVFNLRILRPIEHSSKPVPYLQLSSQFGLPVKHLENLLISARRAYSRNLRLVIGAYTVTEAETEEEIHSIRNIASSAAKGSQIGTMAHE